jgi:hypothetical protein
MRLPGGTTPPLAFPVDREQGEGSRMAFTLYSSLSAFLSAKAQTSQRYLFVFVNDILRELPPIAPCLA